MKFDSTNDKVQGWTNTASGNVKDTVGSALGNEKLQAEGKIEKAQGLGQRTMARAKDAASGALKKTGDFIEKVGDVVEHKVNKKVGDAIERFGDKIEHLGDKDRVKKPDTY